MRGDPRVSPLHCLEEDDEDSGGVSRCRGRAPGAPSPAPCFAPHHGQRAQGWWGLGTPKW